MTIACWALHYGKEYLAWSVRSVQDAVDELHFFYTRDPSYGKASELLCPDTEEELLREAHRFATKPVVWHRIEAHAEHVHRMQMHAEAERIGAEQYLVVDADEVWCEGVVARALSGVKSENRAGRWMANFANFWRSFNWRVLDQFTPIRIVDLRHPLTLDASLPADLQPKPVLHFGYAQSRRTMQYKMSVHGHHEEFRQNYLDTLFFPWRPGSSLRFVHPCVYTIWEEPVRTSEDLIEEQRRVLGDHPYAGLELIE